ncbi:MAG: hypothetical protein WC560_11715 [Syntrophales bacterium]
MKMFSGWHLKIVFDTNAIITAFLNDGVCVKLLTRALRKQFSPVVGILKTAGVF